MRKYLIATGAAAFLFAAIAAQAAEVTATITHIDTVSRIIVVDGRAFHVSANIDIAVYKVGETVTVTYNVENGQFIVVSIKVG